MERKDASVREIPHYLLQNQNIIDQPPFDDMKSTIREAIHPYLGDDTDAVLSQALPAIIRIGARCVEISGIRSALQKKGIKLSKPIIIGIRNAVEPILNEYPYCTEYLHYVWGPEVRMYNSAGKRLIGKTDEQGNPIYHVDKVVSYAAYAYMHVESQEIQKMVGLYEVLPIATSGGDVGSLTPGKGSINRRYRIQKSGLLR